MHELDLARKVFQIPGMTRSYLLLPLMNSDIPSTNVLIRILKFYFNGINSKDEFIGFIFKNSFYSMTLVMCKKCFFIMSNLSNNVLPIYNEEFILSENVKKLRSSSKRIGNLI